MKVSIALIEQLKNEANERISASAARAQSWNPTTIIYRATVETAGHDTRVGYIRDFLARLDAEEITYEQLNEWLQELRQSSQQEARDRGAEATTSEQQAFIRKVSVLIEADRRSQQEAERVDADLVEEAVMVAEAAGRPMTDASGLPSGVGDSPLALEDKDLPTTVRPVSARTVMRAERGEQQLSVGGAASLSEGGSYPPLPLSPVGTPTSRAGMRTPEPVLSTTPVVAPPVVSLDDRGVTSTPVPTPSPTPIVVAAGEGKPEERKLGDDLAAGLRHRLSVFQTVGTRPAAPSRPSTEGVQSSGLAVRDPAVPVLTRLMQGALAGSSPVTTSLWWTMLMGAGNFLDVLDRRAEMALGGLVSPPGEASLDSDDELGLPASVAKSVADAMNPRL